MRYLTEQEVIAINLMNNKGVKLPDLLNSAITRPKQSAFSEEAYPSIF
ncbi:death-on-curing protein [Halalkalibacter nanhaiisediminis]|uniref:Death-on-curing protein n=1 Tax=Halalkalibacter nanhaiisediminis TaxID=688079 RepID=A0A562QQP2_9BACI|nr:death-on-curing protein [Halalkalibacter nanhaiisediminis]